MRELLLAVRADEACHSFVNHTFSGLGVNEENPFAKGNHQVSEPGSQPRSGPCGTAASHAVPLCLTTCYSNTC